MTRSVRLSILVPVRRATETIETTLASLLKGAEGEPVEVIVAVCAADPTARIVRAVSHPQLNVIVSPAPVGVPQLRREAVQKASGDLIAIAEDHCLYPPHWPRSLIDCMDSSPVSAAGGPVINGRRTIAGWAQYFTRYVPYLPPVQEGSTKLLPGNNACYRREHIAACANSITNGFWEAEFNQELLMSGHRFWMDPAIPVEQRQVRGWFEYIPLRFRHGRCYGARRWAASRDKLQLLLRSPLIPAVLFARAVRGVFGKKRFRAIFLALCPLVGVYVMAWAWGELLGYLLGAGSTFTETD